MKVFQSNNQYGPAVIVLAALLGSGAMAFGASKPSAPAPHAAAAPHAAPAAHPSGGGAAHAPTGSTASHGAAGGSATHSGPSANGSHTTATGSHTTTTAGGHTATTAGSHTTAGGNTAGSHGSTGGAASHSGTTASHSPIKSSVPKGSTDHVAKNGSAVRTRAGGKVSDVHDAKRGMDVHHGLDGGRRVSTSRPGGGRMVTERGRRGFAERGYNYHGHEYGRRAYYDHGREYNRYYRGYGYRGLSLNVYAPGYYYGAGFYGWAYNPWASPIAYGWGWGGSPWLGFYGGFFSPYAVYPSASFWLTDYLIANSLQAAYEAHSDIGGGGGGIAVSPTEPWTDSGTQMAQGQSYSISATGMLQFNVNAGSLAPPTGRSGGPQVDAQCRPNRVHDGFPAPQLPCLSLIGKIGSNGVPFEVGNSLTFVAPVTGEFFLGVNDGNLSDNSAGWVASINQDGGGGSATEQASGSPALTPEVKQQIADEVKAQLALENQEATQTAANQDIDAGSSSIARLLADGHAHVFVVGDGLDLTDSTGAECAVSEGDALALRTPPPSDATAANLVVLASKGGKECQSGGTVSVNLTDLQEMQNHLRETIDTGLKELQSKQGQGGLPAAPASAKAPPTQSPYAAVAPPPDPADASAIQQQSQQADAAESEVTQAAQDGGGGTPIAAPAATPAPSVTVALGQTTDQVTAILGKPMKTANLGPKVIYYYDGMKIVFKEGKVSDVE
jgi:hypothetical protein